jgi:hypothetical protein
MQQNSKTTKQQNSKTAKTAKKYNAYFYNV